jgi:hypothetical protein
LHPPLPQRVYPQQKFGNKMYLIVRANGDEFVCFWSAKLLQCFDNSKREKFVANLLCCFGVIDLFEKEKLSTLQINNCCASIYIILHDMWVVEYETLLMWKILTW